MLIYILKNKMISKVRILLALKSMTNVQTPFPPTLLRVV